MHNRVCAVATCNTPLAVTNGSFAFVFLLRVQTKPFVAYYVIIAGISTRCLCTGFVPHELQRKRIVLKERRNPASFHNGSRNHCRLSRRWISAPLCLCSGYCIADIVLARVSGPFLYALGLWSRDILLFMGVCAHDCTTGFVLLRLAIPH